MSKKLKKLDNYSKKKAPFKGASAPSLNSRYPVYGIVYKTYVDWQTCREGFHYYVSRNVDKFLLRYRRGATGRDIAAFIGRIERKLQVSPRTQFQYTGRRRTIWVEPSSWWTSKGMRFSLFTILLRAAQYYKCSDRNFKGALNSALYIKRTEKAVERFLQGYTNYTKKSNGYSYNGWLATFSRKNIDLDKLLEKPKSPKKSKRKKK
ncbi:MAG: hypothetical protein DWQ19_10770 [Crenarchaeota archaeon]|nr:MAG: hypothetical protein DWQ19_10770 [Thermoproteota archaeon]